MCMLYIKNMVCNRCIMMVQTQLDQMGIEVEHIKLGEVLLKKELTRQQKEQFEALLLPLGFYLIDDRKSKIIEQIKTKIVELVHYRDHALKVNVSDWLSSELNHEYNYLSALFSEVEGITIEKYFIAQRIEKIKELLVYDELTLSEIALQLNYSSVAYLSNQFKKVTGLTPSYFKKIRENKRKPLDEL